MRGTGQPVASVWTLSLATTTVRTRGGACRRRGTSAPATRGRRGSPPGRRSARTAAPRRRRRRRRRKAAGPAEARTGRRWSGCRMSSARSLSRQQQLLLLSPRGLLGMLGWRGAVAGHARPWRRSSGNDGWWCLAMARKKVSVYFGQEQGPFDLFELGVEIKFLFLGPFGVHRVRVNLI
ncbi:hypothetical protein SORBI_3003G079466 [Sorghum bicolor]|uniref:Uncharacterized protein n=1 Tax=Sorghum bicolor TaxID=4558 RepID=A0A1W0VW49_SORBI|nr:hypothetical protein SORBI_3003G079466 [Sorghum bicolor]